MAIYTSHSDNTAHSHERLTPIESHNFLVLEPLEGDIDLTVTSIHLTATSDVDYGVKYLQVSSKHFYVARCKSKTNYWSD